MGEAVLEVENLWVRFGDRTVVDGVSFTVRRGEIFGIMGGNGSGKSTTIKAVLGLVRYSGKVEWHVRRKDVAYVPQRPALYLDFTVMENIRIFSRFIKDPIRNVDDLLEYFELTRFANTPVRKLSGGYQKLANLVVSLLSDPSVLIMDEPTAELDYEARFKIMRFLKAMRAAGKTVIIVTHIPGEADELCDRVMVLDAGRKVAEGTPEEILEKSGVPYVVRIYVENAGALDLSGISHARIRRVESEFVELEFTPKNLVPAMREVSELAERVGAERIFLEEPNIIRTIEQGVGGNE